MAAELETYAFNADISQLMSLIINAFYSNKEIFLRELISNASDATDKIQYQAVTEPEKLATNTDLRIRVSSDREAGTVTVEDAGIGMTRSELIANLGTIAKSGTKAFMEAVSEGGDISMIGQFGVGFYSSYLVSEKVRVVSKSNDDEQHVWESTAGGTFVIWKDETFEHGVMKRGTKVICYLKDDLVEFLETDRMKDLILKHSAFVGFPIELYAEHRREHDVEGSEEKMVTITHQWELMNKNKPLWMRSPEEVTHEEYADLYKWFASDYEDHLGVKHVRQGKNMADFKALLYCPRTAPKDMFDMGKMSNRFCIRLYVRRVFIKEFNDLIPKWMGFVKGIVDSDDMPLNIGREKLQQNAILKHVQTALLKNIFQLFEEISKDPARMKIFQESFSQCLKLGVYEDPANRAQIIPLLRYYSSKSGDNVVSLDEYIGRMKPSQKHILYITGRTRRDAARSPYIEGLKRDGFEILYMVDPVDEYAVQFLKEYQGHEVMSCMNAMASRLLDSRTDDDFKAELEPVRRRIAKVLVGKVTAVAFGPDFDPDSFARTRPAEDGLPKLELNFKHGLLKELGKWSEDDEELPGIASFILEAAKVDGSESDDPRRPEVAERAQGLIQRLSSGERDCVGEDVPLLGAPRQRQSIELSVGKAKQGAFLSTGSAVRVVKPDRSRRAIISYADENSEGAVQSVDVIYPLWGGGEAEEEGVKAKAVQKLFDFELSSGLVASSDDPAFKANFWQTAQAVKEEGNQLFKLKDYEAAHERYTVAIEAFCSRPVEHGQSVLAVSESERGRELVATYVSSKGKDGTCDLGSGLEGVPVTQLLPVVQELLPLQTSIFMNRVRCRQNLGLHLEAAQDCTAVLGLWQAADKRMLSADPEMKEAEGKGAYTASYLRGRSRLALGLPKQAAADVKAGLERQPPQAFATQLKQLKAEVQAVQEKYRQVNGPLSKELAKVAIALRGGPQIS